MEIEPDELATSSKSNSFSTNDDSEKTDTSQISDSNENLSPENNYTNYFKIPTHQTNFCISCKKKHCFQVTRLLIQESS